MRFLLLLVSLGIGLRADQFDPVRALIRAKMAEQKVHAVAVAVAQHGTILWAGGYGTVDVAGKTQTTPDTLFSMASISKPITATALMTLVEKGKLDLDQPINRYLAPSKIVNRAGGAPATVRQVLNHTSGLPLHYQFFYEDDGAFANPPTRAETIRRYGNLIRPPGERYEYSNLGFGVIDALITKLSGKEYSAYAKEAVFKPLGMDAAIPYKTPYPNATYAERWAADGTRLPFYEFDHPGASAVYTSANSLAKFGMFHAKTPEPGQKAILKRATLDEMHRPTAVEGSNSGYGIGFRVSGTKQGLHEYGHTGGMGGVSTALRILPEQDLVVVVLTNGRGSLVNDVSNEIIKIMVPGAKIIRGEPVKPEPLPASLDGIWTGFVQTHQTRLPLRLDIKGQKISAKLGTADVVEVTEPKMEAGQLLGKFHGDIGTPDANRLPYTLSLVLKHRGALLNGGLVAISDPQPKVGNALTSWVELKRAAPAAGKPAPKKK